MTTFSVTWLDVEDPKAPTDKVANAAFVQSGLDACTGRVISGVYGSLETIPRIVGDTQQFAGYPFWLCSLNGPNLNAPAGFNSLTTKYVQYALSKNIDGVDVDIDCRVDSTGNLEYGGDLSNFSLQNNQVPSVQWFLDRWNKDNWRFIVFGDQKPFIARAQIANCEATQLPWDFQLYTYLNFPGGDYYAGEDGATQVTRALDALGVPAAPAPPVQAQPQPDVVGLIRLSLERAGRDLKDANTALIAAHELAGGDGDLIRGG